MKAFSNNSQSLAVTEQNQSLFAKLPITLQINIRDNLLIRSSALYTPVKSNLELQAYRVIPSIETSDQRSIQYLQRLTVGQTLKTDLA